MRRWPIVVGFSFGFVALAALFLASVFAGRAIKDLPSSRNGFKRNCPPTDGGGTCLYFNTLGTVNLAGTDSNSQPITVSVTLSDWGSTDTTGKNTVSNVVINLALQGSDTSLNLQRFVMSGSQPGPAFLYCDQSGTSDVPCNSSPLPDSQNLQAPTPIAGGDGKNTQWDFASTPSVDQFIDIQTLDSSCPVTTSQCLGQASLVIGGSFSGDNLSLSTDDYRAIVTDQNGNVYNLGTLALPPTASPAANNTQATARAIPSASFTDFVDTSQLSPSENLDGSMNFASDFVLPPPPSCNPNGINSSTPDTRVFRAAWYSYVAPSDGSVTITTANSRYDTLVYVLSGGSEVACNDDPTTGGLLQAALKPLSVSGGTSYDIVVIETPPEQTVDPDTQATIGYPLSTDGTLYFNLQFSAALPTATLSPATLQFGEELANTSSAAQPLSLTNNGPGSLSITSVVASSGFSQTNSCPTTLSAGASCAINVMFSPASTGILSGTVTVTDAASNGPQTTDLSGTGTNFQASASPFASGTISPGQSTTATITVSPTGTFSSTVSLSCNVAPVTAVPPTCGMSPASVQSGSGTSTLTVSTVPPMSGQRALSTLPPLFSALLLLPIGLVCASMRKSKLFMAGKSGFIARLIGSTLILVMISGCGGSSSRQPQGGTSSGSYTVTVTASGDGGSRTTTLPLTVQ